MSLSSSNASVIAAVRPRFHPADYSMFRKSVHTFQAEHAFSIISRNPAEMQEKRPAAPACRPSVCCSALDARLELRLERIDVRSIDDLGRNDDELGVRDRRLVAFEILGHQFHALIPPLIGLLHDSA